MMQVIQTPPQPPSLPSKPNATVYIVLGWVFFALSLLFIPVLFGAGSFIMGYMIKRTGRDAHGVTMMVLAVAGAILGMLFGFVVGALNS